MASFGVYAQALVLALGMLAGCAPRPITDRTLKAKAPALNDLATEFVRDVCAAHDDTAFAAAWRAYEDRHWRVFNRLYRDAAEREALATELAPRRASLCSIATRVIAEAPSVVADARARVDALCAVHTRAPVYLVAAMTWTDAATVTLDGANAIVINARHERFENAGGLSLSLAHELIHDAQDLRNPNLEETLSPLARKLYCEGGAVFGARHLFPAFADEALAMTPAQRDAAQASAAAAAHELRTRLGARDVRADLQRFFVGGFHDPTFPPRMGYYVGLRVFERLAEARGAEGAMRLEAGSFATELDGLLASVSR